MSLFSNLISATIKTALTPVTIIADVVHIINGEEPTSTIDMVTSATEDVKDGVSQAIEGDIV
jgi:hypothetical protein